MIRDVTQSQADLLKTTQKTEKQEARGKGGQEGVVESRGTRGDRVTLNASEGEAATYSKPLGAAQQIALKFSTLQLTVSTLFTEQGGVGAIGGEASSQVVRSVVWSMNSLGTATIRRSSASVVRSGHHGFTASPTSMPPVAINLPFLGPGSEEKCEACRRRRSACARRDNSASRASWPTASTR